MEDQIRKLAAWVRIQRGRDLSLDAATLEHHIGAIAETVLALHTELALHEELTNVNALELASHSLTWALADAVLYGDLEHFNTRLGAMMEKSSKSLLVVEGECRFQYPALTERKYQSSAGAVRMHMRSATGFAVPWPP
jgi:hypothetical protein